MPGHTPEHWLARAKKEGRSLVNLSGMSGNPVAHLKKAADLGFKPDWESDTPISQQSREHIRQKDPSALVQLLDSWVEKLNFDRQEHIRSLSPAEQHQDMLAKRDVTGTIEPTGPSIGSQPPSLASRWWN